jgi:competence protein ComEA
MKIITAIALALTLAFSQGAIAKDSSTRQQTSQQSISKVNINKASAAEIAAALKGIGLKKAQAIVDYRKKFGDFKTVDELTAVKGIGQKTLQNNRQKISI